MIANNRKDMSGQRFGKLTVINYSRNSNDRKALWNCICDCGRKVIASGKNMREGTTNSCGCFQIDQARKANTKHGDKPGNGRNRLYGIWSAMKSRVTNSNTAHYANYGGRGIIICKEWQYSFPVFKEWAINNGYKDTLTIDRINVNGNYEPENCRWITMKEQSRNKTNSIIHNGETAVEASVRLGGSKTLVASRLNFYGWSIERAFTQVKR